MRIIGTALTVQRMSAIKLFKKEQPGKNERRNRPISLRPALVAIDQLRWQRLRPFQKLAKMLLRHQEGILNYYRTKVPFGVVEAVNGNIKALLRRGRGYRNLHYLLLKAQCMAVQKTEFVVFRKAA
jgi:transposase